MKRFRKEITMMVAVGGLAVAGMGSSCPGTGSSANFTDPVVAALRPVAAPLRSWNQPIVIDPGAVDITNPALDNNQNVTFSGAPSNFPMAVFHDSSENFFAVFNRMFINGALLPPSPVFMYATQQVDMSSSIWASSLGVFTQLDPVPVPAASVKSSYRPTVTVDSIGNAMSVFLQDQTFFGGRSLLLASQHIFQSGGAWSSPAIISDLGNNNNIIRSLSLGHDAYNNVIAAWVQTSPAGPPALPPFGQGTAYFNEYRPGLGWRFHTSSPGAATDVQFQPWSDISPPPGTLSVLDVGVDVGFDSYGNGYGLYVSAVGPVKTLTSARWRSDVPQNFPLTSLGIGPVGGGFSSVSLPGHDVVGMPKIWVANDGSATAFWYESSGSPQLWTARAPATSVAIPVVAWSGQTRLDAGVGIASVYTQELSRGIDIPPMLSYSGTMGAVGFIKSDGTARRLWVYKSTNSGQGWTGLGAADVGGSFRGVTWGNIAVNSNGDIAVVYSAQDPIDFREHVYGNVYTLGAWTGVVEIDTNPNIYPSPVSPTVNAPLPVVSIDDEGNACATFTMTDILFSTLRKRVVAVFYD